MTYSKKVFFPLLILILIRTSIVEGQSFSIQDTSLASRYFEQGNLHFKAAKYDSSSYYFEKAKNIYREISEVNKTEAVWLGLIKSSNKIAWVFIQTGNYDSSLAVLKNTLNLGLQKLGENNLETAQTYYYLGNVNWYKGNYDKALEYYFQSLNIRTQLLGEVHLDVADNYNGIGIIYAEKADYDKALEYFQKSLAIKIYVLGDNHPQVAISYNNIGNILKDQNDFDKALELHNRALAIRLQQLGENHPQVASSYSNIGLVYYKKGDYNKAIDMHIKSLDLRIKLLGEKHFLVATNYNNIGLAYWKLKIYDKALENHQKSLAIKEQLFGKDHNDVAKSYMNIGLIFYETDQDSLALKNYDEALAINLRLLGTKHYEISNVYQNICQVYLRQNDLRTALIYNQKAIQSLVLNFNEDSVYINPKKDEVISEPELLNVLKTKALIFSLMRDENEISNLKMAYSTYELVAELIDKIRTGFRNEGSKLFLGASTSEIYEEAIDISLKLYQLTGFDEYKQQAFLFAEKNKAVVLQEELAESNARQFSGLPDSLLQKEKELKNNLAFYTTQLLNEKQKTDSKDSIKILDYENHLFKLNNSYELLITDLENNYSEYYQLKYQTLTPSVQEIQTHLPGETALLEYFIGDSTIYIFLITKNTFDVKTLKRPDNFSQLVKDYYSSIIKSESEKYLTASIELNKILIEPLLTKNHSVDKLIIIPHDLLNKIPFEAFIITNPPLENSQKTNYSKLNYLVKNFAIAYHYSSSLYYNSLMNKFVKEGKERISLQNFIGFAPVFPKDDISGYTLINSKTPLTSEPSDELFRSSSGDVKKFNELPYTEWEVKSIIDLYSEKSDNNFTAAYFYSDANEESFKKIITNFAVVHIASHSFINEDNPELSGVVFAQPVDSTEKEDGILYAGESYNLNLNADLVVLSSCESGLGKLIRSEGMMALTRGFLYSGASNILFSLWKIPDKHTSELMIEFYKEMLGGNDYSDALRNAKLKLIDNETTARPRSWASFILVGGN